MNWFDAAVAALIALSVVSGVRHGLSRSGFGLIAVIAAFLAAAWLYPENVKGFVIVLAAVICVSAAAAFALGKLFRKVGPEWLDECLGGLFALTNALLISVLAALALMAFAPKQQREYVAHSTFAPYALEAAWTVAEVVPDEMKYRVERSYEELGQALPPRLRKALPQLPPTAM